MRISSTTSPVGIMGVACRLPGAENYDAFKSLLLNSKCAVSEIGDDRFNRARWYHPEAGEAGKSYTFAAGVVKNIFDFDPQPFGISPREAMQMDPQQRLLLQVVWEAIEDCGVPHTALAGRRVGVYVGASTTDYRDTFSFDPGAVDPYLMTGNTLSLISNRISYIFDFNGPSFTVDTACSSSLVAMENAVRALQAGEIDTAIIGGVNALLSPIPFNGFAAAGMLSPQGLCRAFDANGSGYVRAEGAAAAILQRTDLADDAIRMKRPRAEVVAAAVNSDGRTVGVSLPSSKTQGALLASLYKKAGIDVNDIAFFEAHGTGTRVGDPAEAQAIGESVAQGRHDPLLIGSVKTNIGHLEAGAGIAGLLKTLVAFEENVLPASLHFETPNPDIPFEEYNLKVASEKTPLPASQNVRYAGVSTFGFGGTNAHVIIRETDLKLTPEKVSEQTDKPGFLTLSAHGMPALRALAGRYSDLIKTKPDLTIQSLASAVKAQRAALPDTVTVKADTLVALSDILRDFAKGDDDEKFHKHATLTTGRTERENQKIAFVFSGNGAQFAGMGRDEYRANSAFRTHFDNISALAEGIFGWSPREMLLSEDLAEKLEATIIAQPLLFVLQMAVTACLKDLDITPHASFGHSVGEVAAATISGALSLEQGIHVIHARSQQQEKTRGKGKMAVGALSKLVAEPLLADLRSKNHILAIAAINAPEAITVSGDVAGIEAFARQVKKIGKGVKVLDLDYGFHCPLMDPIESGVMQALRDLKPAKTDHTFISTVTGKVASGETLTAHYWWRNIREPVNFQGGSEEAYNLGCRLFIEIGPRSLFRSNLRDTFSEKSEQVTVIETLKLQARQKASRSDKPNAQGRHLELATLKAIASGAETSIKADHSSGAFDIRLPGYPWQNKTYRTDSTIEMINNWTTTEPYHILLGLNQLSDIAYWRSHIDAHVLPLLADHKVDGKIILPGAAYAEIALSAASRFFSNKRVEIRDMDIMRALEISDTKITEMASEISADTSSITISSRDRLDEEDWTLNAQARIAVIPHDAQTDDIVADSFSGDHVMDGSVIYPLARDYGLDYGPAFARVESIFVNEDNVLQVNYSAEGDTAKNPYKTAPFMLDPTDLDIAFHGLIALYDHTDTSEIKRGFIPIRFGKLQILKPFIRTSFARIYVRRVTSRSIVADFELYDTDGHMIARLQEGRFRAVSLVQRQMLKDYSYHFTTRATPHPLIAATALERAPLSLPERSFLNGNWAGGDARLLLEASAQRIAFDAVTALTANNVINIEALLSAGRIQPDEVNRLSAFLSILEEINLTEGQDTENNWFIANETDLPPCEQIIRTILSVFPDWSAEVVMLSRLMHHTRNHGLSSLEKLSLFDDETKQHFITASPFARDHLHTVLALIEASLAEIPAGHPVRILEIGNEGGELTRSLINTLDQDSVELVSVGSSKKTKSRLKLATVNAPHVTILDITELPLLIDKKVHFDLIVSANGLHRESDVEAILRQIHQLIAHNGRFIISETMPTALHDVLLSFEENWFERTAMADFPLSTERTAEEWARVLSAAGFSNIHIEEADDNSLPALVIQAARTPLAGRSDNLISLIDHKKPTDDIEETAQPIFILVDPANESLAQGFKNACTADCIIIRVKADNHALPLADLEMLFNDNLSSLVRVVDLSDNHAIASQENLSAHIARFNGLVKKFSNRISNIWLLAPGGARALAGQGKSAPFATGLWAYARTVRNEYTEITIKTLDFSEDLAPADQALLLALHVEEDQGWTEAILSKDACLQLKAATGFPENSQHAEKPVKSAMMSTLAFQDISGVDALYWKLLEQREPQAGEVAIEVVATGLNFRDVMWTLGVLPDEALEDGFAGATLGFECSGRVIAIGEGVTKVAVGDPVIALGPACFSSRLVVEQISVARLPDDVDLIAAATLPVTFLTAYYALNELARLEADEWILIQGGAGGVGLAAIQIAQWQGARIIATAGSEEKRNLLETLGVDHVLDSRSLNFVEDVMAITGDGVDCVLNSLFGEAMERGIELLKPFGRFLELGKRDYYGNTKIGLRPFRRNITYFGIDADQLLAQRPKLAERLFTELMRLFEDDTFTALPYRLFDGSKMVDAFRLMQKSGHIGKIVVTPVPPETLRQPAEPKPVTLSGDGHFVVIGGLGGFGLEVAKWLVAQGVRHITLTSRGGKVDKTQIETIEALRVQGANISPVACDVANEEALASMLSDLRKTAPIKGVIHAAMVLRDGLIENMSVADIDDVLTPKVKGAGNLDRLTREDPLETFILFSSITTFIGNPGQASYVAANGYLEGLARQRREEGLPALAIGWGAISDAGYLARNESVSATINKRTGTRTFTAKQALDALTRILSLDGGSVNEAVISVAPIDWSIAKGGLSILSTPPFTIFERMAEHASQGTAERLDIAALIDGKTNPEARAIITHILAKEASSVLRMALEDINTKRPLADLGMDSLMGVELRMSAKQKLDIDIPLTSIANGVSIEEIARKVIERFRAGDEAETIEDITSLHIDASAYKEELRDFYTKPSKYEE